jgi:hypothetical protein
MSLLSFDLSSAILSIHYNTAFTEYETRICITNIGFFWGCTDKFVPRLDVYIETAIAEGSIVLGQNIT